MFYQSPWSITILQMLARLNKCQQNFSLLLELAIPSLEEEYAAVLEKSELHVIHNPSFLQSLNRSESLPESALARSCHLLFYYDDHRNNARPAQSSPPLICNHSIEHCAVHI